MWAASKSLIHSRRRGFTIVELLIVIVVIAILAVVVIVAYNGIQNRAKAASAQAAASQASKKVLSYAIQNAEAYPASLAVVGVTNSGDTSYQYSFNNAATPKTFCVTTTTQDVSFWTSNASATPTSGGCPGHGVGGVAPITNLVVNPSAETSLTGWTNRSAATSAISTSTPIFGSQSVMMTATGGGASVISSASGGAYPITAVPGTVYRGAMSFRPLDVTSQLLLAIDWYNGSTYVSTSTGATRPCATPG